MDRLPLDLVTHVFSHLGAFELAEVGCVSRAFRRASVVDSLWAELLDRDGIRSFMRRLDRRERIRVAVGRTPTVFAPPVAELRSFIVRGPTASISSPHAAYSMFCSTFRATGLLRTRHRCCPHGMHPEAITDAVSNAMIVGGSDEVGPTSSSMLFVFYERLWCLLEDWLLRNGLLATYLSFGMPLEPSPAATERGTPLLQSVIAALLVTGGGQVALAESRFSQEITWNADDVSLADVTALLPPRLVTAVPGIGSLALFGIGTFYSEAIINLFVPYGGKTFFFREEGWEIEAMPLLRCNHNSFVAVVVRVAEDRDTTEAALPTPRQVYHVGHVVHANLGIGQPLLGLSPNFETFVFQWVRDLCLLQRFDFDSETQGICRFPRYGSGRLHGTSVAVTHGVEVFMAACLIPHRSGGARGFHYAYKCRLRLLPESPFPSVQLTHRMWKITNLASLASEVVEGEGVVGLTPILVRMTEQEARETHSESGIPHSVLACTPSRTKVFAYSSMTSFDSPQGLMEGHFRFVPGTVEVPYGETFLANVAPFHCCFNETERLRFGEW
jgi:uncharacterized protein affecting Mg2+/Co2+ transport